MKRIRVNIITAVILLAFQAWPSGAEEPRGRSARDQSSGKRSTIIQTANEVPADAQSPEFKAESELPSPIAAEYKPTGRTWTLSDLEQIANSMHPVLQRDVLKIDAARGDALQAGLYPNPRFDTNNPQVFSGPTSTFNAGFQQEIVVRGKKRLDRAAAVKVVQQNEFAYVQDRFGLLTAVRQQFYTVLAAERRVKALTKLQEITSSSLETGKELVRRAGEIPPIDVLVLEIDSQRVEADLENAVRILRGARNQLAAIVGDQSISDDEFTGSLFDPPPQYDEQILKHFASMDSAYVQIQKLEIERNEILLKRAIVEPYPNVNLGPAYQWGLQNGNEQYWLTLTFPIPTWDRNQGAIQSQRAELAASRQNLEAVKLEQLRRVADAFSRNRAVRMQATKYEKEIIPNVRKTLRLAKNGYQMGEYDFPRFLQVQRTFVEVNMAYIDLLETVWTSAAELSGLLQLESF